MRGSLPTTPPANPCLKGDANGIRNRNPHRHLQDVRRPVPYGIDSLRYVYSMQVGDRADVLQVDSIAPEDRPGPEPIGCRLRFVEPGTSLTSGSETRVPWLIEEADTDGMHSLTTNPSRITIQRAGWYSFAATVQFTNNATGARQAKMTLNADLANPLAADTKTAVSGLHTALSLAVHMVYCEVGDYIEVWAYQNSGGALALQGDASSLSCMMLAADLV